jgi:cytochrome P450
MNAQSIDEAYAFDPTDMAKSKDFELMARIRRERGVVRPAEGIVLTTRYEPTRQAFLDAKRFSSVGDMRAPGVVVPREESFLGELDAPVHPKIRRILLRGFTRSRARLAEDWSRASVRRRLEAVAKQGGGDLMAALAIPLPGSVSAHELGIPDELHDPVMDWCNELLHSSWPATGKTVDEDGWRIGNHHVRTLVVNVLSGSLSASYMIGNLLYRLFTDPGFGAALRADERKVELAVDESLRFEAPVTFLFRTAREDAEIGGTPVYEGEHVMLGIAAANRDEDVWENAEEFRLDREGAPEHLSFGFGPHICLGNHLTRMIGRVVLEEVMETFGPKGLRLADGFEWICVDHLQEYGPETLDVVVA